MKALTFTAIAVILLACSKGPSGEVAEKSQALPLTGAEGDAAASAPAMAPQAGIGSIGPTRQMTQTSAVMDRAESQTASQSPAAIATSDQIAPSMLIRTGNASVEVDKLDPAIMKVRQLALQLGGYVANSSISGGRDQVRSATLELKIPAARYDQAIGGLNGIGKVEAVNTSVEDVGEEFVDVTARVTNAKRLEERLATLLATRTGKLEDVLAVERELARVREEIERYEGRLRFLKTRAAVSTLSVTVHEPLPLLGHTPGDNPIAGALKQAWRNFVSFVAWLIASLGVLVPLSALLVAGWYGYRRFRKGFKG
ncbi:MAG TPA: DUF4349 domain-containing protein [Gemmatimonadaceae bacterium]|nr:DUF4349 domain-containing protein [Gemmatimonadaceae bacterium]